MKNSEQHTDHETLLLLVQDIKNLKEGQDVFHNYTKEILTRIEAQTIKTNGRVNGLEQWRATSTGWTAGAGACLFIIIALCTYIFKSELSTINAKETDTQALLTQHINK